MKKIMVKALIFIGAIFAIICLNPASVLTTSDNPLEDPIYCGPSGDVDGRLPYKIS